jgi:CxxC motif-containing protein
MIKELVCIVCPRGCRMKVDTDNDYKVTGNQCPRGIDYGVKELTAPTRVITSTIKVKGGIHKRVPVKTSDAIPKGLNYECMKIINSIEVESPVTMGDVVVENVLDTGVDIVITRNM